MKEPVDSFGRKFKDMPGDSWAIDTGQYPVITPEGKLIVSGGSFPDEAMEYEDTGLPILGSTGGFTAPTSPMANKDAVAQNLGANRAAWVRFVPKRDYTCRSVSWIAPTVVPLPVFNMEVGIWVWDPAQNDTKQIAWVRRTDKVRNGLNIWDVGSVPLAKGLPHYVGLWGDKAWNGFLATGFGSNSSFLNNLFMPTNGNLETQINRPHPVFIDGTNNLDGLAGRPGPGFQSIQKLFAYWGLGTGVGFNGQLANNGWVIGIRESSGNLPV